MGVGATAFTSNKENTNDTYTVGKQIFPKSKPPKDRKLRESRRPKSPNLSSIGSLEEDENPNTYGLLRRGIFGGLL